jgi:hypothetical protein
MKCGHWRAIDPHGEVNFEGTCLLLGVAYVQLQNVVSLSWGREVSRGCQSFVSTEPVGAGVGAEWRMYGQGLWWW